MNRPQCLAGENRARRGFSVKERAWVVRGRHLRQCGKAWWRLQLRTHHDSLPLQKLFEKARSHRLGGVLKRRRAASHAAEGRDGKPPASATHAGGSSGHLLSAQSESRARLQDTRRKSADTGRTK